eukprot:Hpha_TRINITY_DN36186_c0_g1::TRINITY_DN36186_c0_g1_i1::g.36184::m.36184
MGGPSWESVAADFTDTAPHLAEACAAASRATAAADSLSVVAAACAAVGTSPPPFRGGHLLAPPRPLRYGFDRGPFDRASPSPLPEAEHELDEEVVGLPRRSSPLSPSALFAPRGGGGPPAEKAMRSCLAELVAHHRLVTREYEDKVLTLERELHDARTTITKLTERYEELQQKGDRVENDIKARLRGDLSPERRRDRDALSAALARAGAAEERLKDSEAEVAMLRALRSPRRSPPLLPP